MKALKISFNKSIVFLLWIIVAAGPSYGFDKTFTFDLADFTLINQNGVVQIKPNNFTLYSFDYNYTGYPDIPFFRYVISTDKPCDMSTLWYEVISSRTIATNVSVQLNEPYVVIGADTQEQEDVREASYLSYPDSLIRLYNGPDLFDDQIVLAIAPFIYDKTSKSLSFVDQIRVCFNELPAREKSYEMSNDRLEYEQFDYLIITQDSLKETFKELRDWKTTKGVKTEIVTLDSIASYYNISSLLNLTPYDIKRYIRFRYICSHIKMVLLGGTFPLVPAQECLIDYKGDVQSVLSDMYYACLNDDWTWNANGNSVIGELTGDGVNLTPSISVTRLPVETKAQLSSYIHKLLQYEKNPQRNGYLSHLLLSGSEAHWCDGQSDAEFESEQIFEGCIEPYYPNITKHYFYDTGNDLGRHGTDSIVNAANLSEIIEDFRPHWLSMDCHGSPTQWLKSSITPIFTVNDAAALENDSTPMVITTAACLTSDFSNSYPCLAESFLRHPSGGAIAYWGSSHYGFGTLQPLQHIGPSMTLCGDFWQNLSSNYHFGDAVMKAKKAQLSNAYDSVYPYNWLLKSMNALGDCELPIYTNEPSEFSNIFIRVLWDAVYVKPDSFSVAVTSKGDNGASYFYVDTLAEVYCTSDPFIPVPCNICFTKKNYIPFVTETGHFVCTNDNYDLYLQDISYTGNEVYYEADKIFVGNQVDNTVANGDVIVEPGAKLSTYAFNRNVIQSGFRCKLGGQIRIGIEIDYTELQ